MAILVNTPSTVQFTGAPAEPQEASVNPLVPGFTEELANAMQPTSQPTEDANAEKKRLSQGLDAKLSGLQILPPDVLLNAVEEANFAFAAPGNQAVEDAIAVQDNSAEEAEASLINALDASQAAEMAGTALAAQKAAELAAQAPAVDASLDTSKVALETDAIVSVGGVATSIGAQLGGTANLKDASASADPLSPSAANASKSSKSGGEPEPLAVNASNPSLNQAAVITQITEGQTLQSNVFTAEARPVNGIAQTPETLINADALQNNRGPEKSQALPSSNLLNQQASTAISKGDVSSNLLNVETLQNNLGSEKSQSLISENQLQSPTIVANSSGLIDAGIASGEAKQISGAAFEKSVSVSQTGTVDAPDVKFNLEGSQQNVAVLGFQSSEVDLAKSDLVKPSDLGTSNALQTGQNLASESSISALEKDDAGLPDQENMAGNLELIRLESSAPIEKTMVQPLQVSSTELNQDTSFKFDAKLGGQLPDEALALPANFAKPDSLNGVQRSTISGALTEPVSAAVPAQFKAAENQTPLRNPSVDLDDSLAVSSPNKVDLTTNLQQESSQKSAFFVNSQTRDSQIEKETTVKERSVDAQASEELAAANFNVQSVAEDNTFISLNQADSHQPVAKSFSDVASTFVSTLVGGPQRPITTVMDWVALNPHEPPRPVMPHELRLDAGAVQVEIQRMVKQGGGHVVMELTPPDQSKFTIELKLDDKGGAYLRVEGVSDSTKTRLEQSAPQLQEQFQQMGLNLQLDMRQNKDSSSSGAANWTPNEPEFDNAKPQEASAQTTRAVATERARNNNGGQVYLYA